MTTAGILHSAASRRGAFAASLVEAAAAVDFPTTGLAFAVLVDDPASASDHVDALVGELMVEAASAAATVTASSVRGAAVVEEAAAASTTSFFGAFTYSGTVAEPAAAVDTVNAALAVTYNVSVYEDIFALDSRQDSTAIFVAPLVTRALSGISGAVILNEDNSGTTRVVAGVGMVTNIGLITTNAATVAEAASSYDAFVAEVTGSTPPTDHWELDAGGEYTPWFTTIGGSTFTVTVSGTWSGTIVVDLEGGPSSVFSITTNGTYTLTRAEISIRLRMTGYVSGTAVVTPSSM